MSGSSAMFATTAISTGMQMYGNYKSAQEQAKAEKYNANIASQRAMAIRIAGQNETARLRRQKDTLLSTQKARYAKAGVLFEGSPMEVMIDSATQYELDIANTRYNYETEALMQDYEANYRRKRANDIKKAGMFNAFASGASGASNIASQFYTAQQYNNRQKIPIYQGIQ